MRSVGLGSATLRSHGQRRPLIASGRTPPALGFRLRGGEEIPGAYATLYLPASERDRLIQVLKAHLEPIGVQVPIEPVDLEW